MHLRLSPARRARSIRSRCPASGEGKPIAKRIKKHVHKVSKRKSITVRSGLEKRVAESLDRRGYKYEYENQTLLYTVPEQVHKYRPDFTLPNNVIIEVKGRFTAADRRKMALVIEQNPDKDIRLLFQTDNKISSNSRTRYSDWCAKRGIKYHVSSRGEIPREWLEQLYADDDGESTDDE